MPHESPAPARTTIPITVDLRNEIKREAIITRSTMTHVIERRLRESMERDPVPKHL